MENIDNFDGYEIIELPDDTTLADLDLRIYDLDTFKKNGVKKCYKYKGQTLYPGITHQAAWFKFGGMSFEEYANNKKAKEDLEYKIEHRRENMDPDDLRRINQYKEVRNQSPDGKEVKDDCVIAGIKYMAEYPDISQDEFVQGLIDRGCLFTINDVHDIKLKPYSKENFRNGEITAAAFVLACAKDSETARMKFKIDHFNIDNDDSGYHFIRLVTGNNEYTKEYVDKLIADRKKNNIGPKKVK